MGRGEGFQTSQLPVDVSHASRGSIACEMSNEDMKACSTVLPPPVFRSGLSSSERFPCSCSVHIHGPLSTIVRLMKSG